MKQVTDQQQLTLVQFYSAEKKQLCPWCERLPTGPTRSLFFILTLQFSCIQHMFLDILHIKTLSCTKGKGKGICFNFRVQISMWLHMFFRLFLPWQWAHSSVQLLIQPWICAPGTHQDWVDRGSVEYEVCLILLHMAGTGNWTPDRLILSPTPYPLGHMFPH